jgi:hypothetical protein
MGTKGTPSRRGIPSMFSSVVTSLAKLSPRTVEPIGDAFHCDVDMVEAVFQILTIIAPTLQTLFISFECRWIKSSSFASVWTNFPALPFLRELSLNYRAPTDALFNYYILRISGSFPSLRRLDISGLKLLSYRFHLFGCIAKIAPSLTHLRLPAKMAFMNVPFSSPGIWPPTQSWPEDDNLPVTLNRVLVQLNGPHSYTDTCGDGRRSHAGCTRCRLLAMTTTDERFVALEAPSNDTWQGSRERLEDEWKDRNSDGEGGWNEVNAVDR